MSTEDIQRVFARLTFYFVSSYGIRKTDFLRMLAQLHPDALLVVFYSQVLKDKMI